MLSENQAYDLPAYRPMRNTMRSILNYARKNSVFRIRDVFQKPTSLQLKAFKILVQKEFIEKNYSPFGYGSTTYFIVLAGSKDMRLKNVMRLIYRRKCEQCHHIFFFRPKEKLCDECKKHNHRISQVQYVNN